MSFELVAEQLEFLAAQMGRLIKIELQLGLRGSLCLPWHLWLRICLCLPRHLWLRLCLCLRLPWHLLLRLELWLWLCLRLRMCISMWRRFDFFQWLCSSLPSRQWKSNMRPWLAVAICSLRPRIRAKKRILCCRLKNASIQSP